MCHSILFIIFLLVLFILIQKSPNLPVLCTPMTLIARGNYSPNKKHIWSYSYVCFSAYTINVTCGQLHNTSWPLSCLYKMIYITLKQGPLSIQIYYALSNNYSISMMNGKLVDHMIWPNEWLSHDFFINISGFKTPEWGTLKILMSILFN